MIRNRAITGRIGERFRRAISEFLAIPVAIVAAFFALALLLSWFDHDAGSPAHWGAIRSGLGRYVGDNASATSLLSTIASSLITVTSITFSILLLALQQGASALTSQVIEHYLRRPSNRVYFGLFVGTSVFTLVTLVLTTANSRPVFGVTVATFFACMALFALILLIYSTIDQIKPVTIVNTIHDATLKARAREAAWLTATAPCDGSETGAEIRSDANGYLTGVRLAALRRLTERHPGSVLTIAASVGDYVPCGGLLARFAGVTMDEGIEDAVRRALPVEAQRDVATDAGLGVTHLVDIAWTTISTAKSNPSVGKVACDALADVLLRWAPDGGAPAQAGSGAIRYRDTTMRQLIDGFETIVVVSSEAMQHQTLAIALGALADSFARLPRDRQDQVEALLLTSLTAIGDHLPTRVLEEVHGRCVAALAESGRTDAAATMSEGWRAFAATRGTISSRGARA